MKPFQSLNLLTLLFASALLGGCYSTPPVPNLSAEYKGLRFPAAASDIVTVRWQDDASAPEPIEQPAELLLGTVEGVAYKDLARRDVTVLAKEVGASRVELRSRAGWVSGNCIPSDYDRHNRWFYGRELAYRAWFFGSRKAIKAAYRPDDSFSPIMVR